MLSSLLSSLPLEGSEAARAAMNDSPVDCQNREWTEPQRDRWHGAAVTDEVVRKITPLLSVAVFSLILYHKFHLFSSLVFFCPPNDNGNGDDRMTQDMRDRFVRLDEQSRTKNPQARYAMIAFLQSSIDCGDAATFEDIGFCYWNISDQYALLRDGHSQ